MKHLSIVNQIVQESINESSLSQSGIATDADQAAMSLPCLVISLAEGVALCRTAYNIACTAVRCHAQSTCGGLIINDSYRCNEPITDFGYGLDVPVVTWFFIQSL